MPHKMEHMYLCIISWLERRDIFQLFDAQDTETPEEDISKIRELLSTNDSESQAMTNRKDPHSSR